MLHQEQFIGAGTIIVNQPENSAISIEELDQLLAEFEDIPFEETPLRRKARVTPTIEEIDEHTDKAIDVFRFSIDRIPAILDIEGAYAIIETFCPMYLHVAEEYFSASLQRLYVSLHQTILQAYLFDSEDEKALRILAAFSPVLHFHLMNLQRLLEEKGDAA